MKRRFFYRLQKALLVAGIRLGYGGTIAVLWFVLYKFPDSVLARSISKGSLEMMVVSFVMLVSSVLLVVDSMLDFLWPLINSRHTEYLCGKNKLSEKILESVKSKLTKACGIANRCRHWLYMPPAIAALFMIPIGVWLGVYKGTYEQLLYAWLCVCGVGCALIEGAINNERGKYEN